MPAHDSTEIILALLHGNVDIIGRMPNSSNATFLVSVTHDNTEINAIYKPLRGERPLWDFEPGLHKREVAAYELNKALGLDIVPPTVLRRDAPLDEGSLQLFIHADESRHYFNLYEERPDLHDSLREFAFFDIVANNTDRKGGHLLIDADSHIWGIDHGVCFSADFKLRTVIWEFGGEDIPDHLLVAAERVLHSVPVALATLLTDDEIVSMNERIEWLVDNRVYPVDHSGRRYPWPLL